MSPLVTREKGFSLISLSQPTARCHGNTEPVEGVKLHHCCSVAAFTCECISSFDLLHHRKRMFVHVAPAFLRLFRTKCLFMCERGGGGRTRVRMNESKLHEMPLSPWLQNFDIFLNKPSQICAGCVSHILPPSGFQTTQIRSALSVYMHYIMCAHKSVHCNQ